MSNCRLGRVQDSNAVLSHFNEYSEHCFAEVSGDFSRNARLLKSMKGDLDYIFQKLRYHTIPFFFFLMVLKISNLTGFLEVGISCLPFVLIFN